MKATLFKQADWIITMDDARTRLRGADLLVQGSEILAIGRDLEEAYRGKVEIGETIDARGKLLLPGFVNAHHHTWQSLIRNIKATQGMALEPWLKVMYEVYKDLSPEVARAGVYVSLGDCMKTGCTTSNDLWYPHPVGVPKLVDAEIEAAREIGIRFHPVRAYHSVTSDIVPPEVVDTTEGVMADAERLIEGRSVTVRFSRDWSGEVDMTVERIGDTENGRSAVVFSTDKFLSDTTLLRRQTVELVFDSITGIRVPKQALRVDQQTVTDEETGEESQTSVPGVYTLVGEQAEFKPVTVLYEGDSFVLVEPADSNRKSLRAGDVVIVASDQLYDGMVIQ